MAEKVKNMRTILMTFTSLFVLATGGYAEDFTGWCVDMGQPGCQDRYIPFYENSIGWCEESCFLTNRVKVTNMLANLYDYTCQSDHAGTVKSRVMILTQTVYDNTGTEVDKHSFITNYGTLPLVQCP